MALSFRRAASILVLTALALGASDLALKPERAAPEVPPISGIVRETEIHIAPEINGHLAAVYVRPGQPVKKGDLLALLSNPELTASVLESKAALGRSQADRDNVFAGVRKEVVDISAEDIGIANAKLVLAKRQYDRTASLAQQGFAPQQVLDERTAT